jgi:hypothetical protein
MSLCRVLYYGNAIGMNRCVRGLIMIDWKITAFLDLHMGIFDGGRDFGIETFRGTTPRTSPRVRSRSCVPSLNRHTMHTTDIEQPRLQLLKFYATRR